MTATAKRVQKHRLTLRKHGLRPVQIWVADTRQRGFALECRRQSTLLIEDVQEKEIARFLGDAPLQPQATTLKRGDVILVALPGSADKTCPAVVIQSSLFAEHPYVTVLPVLPVIQDLRQGLLFRIEVEPSKKNGLRHASQVMIDKAATVSCAQIGAVSGRLDDADMLQVNRALAVWFGFA
jgi:mRNA interferase MazF